MISHAQGELLAQVRPDGTTATLAFTALMRTEITLILAVVDPSAGPASAIVALYHDDAGGATYNQTTIIGAKTVTKNDGVTLFQARHPGSGIHVKPGGQIAVQTDNADDATFSIYGITENIAQQYNAGGV